MGYTTENTIQLTTEDLLFLVEQLESRREAYEKAGKQAEFYNNIQEACYFVSRAAHCMILIAKFQSIARETLP